MRWWNELLNLQLLTQIFVSIPTSNAQFCLYNLQIFSKKQMTKKVRDSVERKNKQRFESYELQRAELKTFAIKKVRQLQMVKTASSKISKTRSFTEHLQKKKTKVQKEVFEEIIDQSVFQCPVCLELMIEPTLLQCGHAYCFKCIQQLMIYKSSCGVCRNLQSEPQFQRSKYLETLIEKVLLRKSQNYLDYYCRVADSQNWKKVRNVQINELSKGSFVDFRDKDLKWRKAQITRITLEEHSNVYLMQLKYKKQGQIIEETVSSDSGRYAKFSYYTRMKYLEANLSCTGMDNAGSEDVLFTPFTSSFRNLEEGSEDIFAQVEEETPIDQQSENIQLEQSILPDFHFEENEFLNEIFQTEDNLPMDLIQLLA